jgi:sialidase-1
MRDQVMRNRRVLVMGLAGVVMGSGVTALAAEKSPLWIHPGCKKLPTDKQGPFVRTGDGAILAIGGTEAFLSRDEGKTWEARPLFQPGQKAGVSSERALIRTKDGAIILAFINTNEEVWKWNAARRDADPSVKSAMCILRSLDDGKTWQDFQTLHTLWTGDVRDMIQTRGGRVVVSTMIMLNDPGRHAVVTYASVDNGKTWKRSNIIDLGGNGHHDGAIEAPIEQLKDGRIWMLIRTNWDCFWEAFSTDDGRSWRIIRPSAIPAASSPGMLKRLASGRLILVWNRPYPEGKTIWPRIGGDGQWSDTPALNHREELSVAFSEDDGTTWSKPVVIARQAKASLAYPHVFEQSPGVLWITTMQGGIRVSLRESDLVKAD